MLKANQTKKAKFAPDRFLEVLYRAYRLVAGKEGSGKAVPLSSIYEAMTLLPGTSSEYDKTDFGRDMFLLDRSEITQTRSGAKLSLPNTGRGVFVSFVSPEGEPVNYTGISFTEAR